MIRRAFGSFVARKADAGRADGTVPMPEKPVYVIGDIHGRIDLLEVLLTRIAGDRIARNWDDCVTVLVGDYIDRGHDSAAVLARCAALEADPEVTCLMGNHEAMFLDFMSGDGGDASAILWLRNGGRATLESYGAALPIRIDGVEMIDDLRTLARARIPADIVDWVGRRPLVWTSGNLAVCHATPDPLIPLAELPEDELVWGRPTPGMPERCDGFWLVHGHTIVRVPRITGRRINVDTGAFESNVLTAAVVAPGAPIRFLDTV